MNKKIVSNNFKLYLSLMRFDKPIGIFLLMWPTMSSLWLANKQIPSLSLLLIFSLGVIVMRSLGCVINDFIDRKIDINVKRTKNRPLSRGLVTITEVKIIIICLLLIAFFLVKMTNFITIILAIVGILLSIIYPFMKRYTNLAQFFLGVTFSWSIPMTWTASEKCLSLICWLFYIINIFWIVIYDTQYAMIDKDDDIKIGIKSIAILLKNKDKYFIGILQILVLVLMICLGKILNLQKIFYLILIILVMIFIYQQYLMFTNIKKNYFKAFLTNNYIGLTFFLDIVLNYQPFVNYF